MAQNWAASHLNTVDERYFTKAVTDDIINKGIRLDFNGKRSVTIYDVDVVAEVDYVRSGFNRFGDVVELGTGEQTFTLSQDKAFTFTVDRGNLNDSMMVQQANAAAKRQIREVSVPNTDKYRLATLHAYAGVNGQTATNALIATDVYQKILLQNAELFNATGEEDGLVLIVTPTTYNLLKRDPEFVRDCDTTYRDLKKGIMGEVDGMKIKRVRASYLPANCGFMIVSDKVLVSPTKMNSVRVLTEVQGIDGAVVEGRRYYDAFIPKNKGAAIRVHQIA
jgi:hypothetical protein